MYTNVCMPTEFSLTRVSSGQLSQTSIHNSELVKEDECATSCSFCFLLLDVIRSYLTYHIISIIMITMKMLQLSQNIHTLQNCCTWCIQHSATAAWLTCMIVLAVKLLVEPNTRKVRRLICRCYLLSGWAIRDFLNKLTTICSHIQHL